MEDLEYAMKAMYTRKDGDGPSTVARDEDSPSAVAPVEDGPSAVAQDEDGPSIVLRDDDGPSAVARDDGPSAVARDEDGHSAVARDVDGPSVVARDKDGPSAVARDEDGPSVVARDEDGPSAVARDEDGSCAVAPDEDGPSAVAPDEDESSAVAPDEDESSAVAPDEDESSAVAPDEDESSAVAPDEDESSAVAPDEDESSAVATDEDESRAVAPDEDESSAVAPDEDESSAMAPDEDESSAVAPDEDESSAVAPDEDESSAVAPDEDGSSAVALDENGPKDNEDIPNSFDSNQDGPSALDLHQDEPDKGVPDELDEYIPVSVSESDSDVYPLFSSLKALNMERSRPTITVKDRRKEDEGNYSSSEERDGPNNVKRKGRKETRSSHNESERPKEKVKSRKKKDGSFSNKSEGPKEKVKSKRKKKDGSSNDKSEGPKETVKRKKNDDSSSDESEGLKEKVKRKKKDDSSSDESEGPKEKVKRKKMDDSSSDESEGPKEKVKSKRKKMDDSFSDESKGSKQTGKEEVAYDELDRKTLDENSILRDINMKGLYIKKHRTKIPKGKSKNTRVYDNTHACYFCNKIVLHINLHLQTHRNEVLVKKILKEENKDFTHLRKLGDDKHNKECIEKGKGEILLARRPNESQFDVTQFGPCPKCREWICLKGIRYHYKDCVKKGSIDTLKLKKKDLVLMSEVLAGHVKGKSSKLMLKEVIPIMTYDDISKVAQNDEMIMALGESWVRRNQGNKEKRKYYASARMRLCARLLIHLNQLECNKKVEPATEIGVCDSTTAHEEPTSKEAENFDDFTKINSTNHCEKPEEEPCSKGKDSQKMWDFLRPQHFDNIVLAALKCSFPNADDTEELEAPSNAIKLKYDLKRMINEKWAFVVKKTGNEMDPEAQECTALNKLMDVQWKEKVTVIARAVLNRRRFEQVKELPSPADVEKLTCHLVKEMSSTPLKDENYRRLVVLAQARLLLYNKRRTGELEVIKLHSYASRSKGLDNVDESLAGDLTAVEKKLMETQDLMKVRGKRGRPVPVIVPKDVKIPLAFLADRRHRQGCGIEDDNPYLFPNSTNSYVRAYESLKTVCGEISLVAPHQITSVSMRKYTATLTQMLNLDKNQMEWVYQHLGHTKAVHKEHYRQMSGLLERTQVSKMFLIQDLNLTSKFKGRKLDELDIKDIVFADSNYEEKDDSLPEQLSIPVNNLLIEESRFAEDAGNEEEEEDEREEEEGEESSNKKGNKNYRQRWTKQETEELKKYFSNFLKLKTCPRQAEVEKMKQKSKKDGGVIHLRANHLIVKKISNMNHSK